MHSAPVYRTQDEAARPVATFRHPDDVFEALFQSIQGGEKHVRPSLELTPDSAFLRFIEIGYALRACLENPSRRDYMLQRLRPHLSAIIGTLPASLLPHGMLPRTAPPPDFRPLEQIDDAELHAWLVQDAGLIYGELQRFELENYFNAIAEHIRPGGVMVDLGSGLGKVVMSAALAFPFQRCIGVELMAYRHAMAIQRMQGLLALARQALVALPEPVTPDTPLRLPFGGEAGGNHLLELGARIAFIEADLFKVDVRGASLVFMYSTCFGPLMDAIGEKLACELREGALVSTTTYPLKHPAFKLLNSFPAGTVAWTTVMLYQRIGPLETLLPAAAPFAYEPDAAAWEERARADFAALDAQRNQA